MIALPFACATILGPDTPSGPVGPLGCFAEANSGGLHAAVLQPPTHEQAGAEDERDPRSHPDPDSPVTPVEAVRGARGLVPHRERRIDDVGRPRDDRRGHGQAVAVRMRGRVPLEGVGAVLELLVNLRLTLQPQSLSQLQGQ